MHQFTFRERFVGTPNPISGGLYAPMTLPAPVFSHQTDYRLFKKTLAEKAEVSAIKAQHKRELIKQYGKGNTNRKINPSESDS